MVNNMTDLTAHDAAPAWQTRDHLDDPVIGELRNRFGPDAFTVQPTRTGVPVVWVKREQLLEVGYFLKKLPKPYVMLFDLHGMDERLRTHRDGLPAADFSVFYHLISIDRNRDIMLKVALSENDLHLPTFTKLFPNANWYERETRNVWHYLRWSPEPASHHDAADPKVTRCVKIIRRAPPSSTRLS